jgi:hypothetical protein
MLHEAHYIGGCVSRGMGPRMVVELDPDLKRSLYAELARDGLTFKGWLTREAHRYVTERRQPLLFVAEPSGPSYYVGEKR